LLPPYAIEGYVQYYSEQVGPYIGKAVVAQAWVDKAFRDALLNPQNPRFNPYRNHADRGPFAAAVYIREFLDRAAAEGRLGFQWPPAQGLQGTLLGPEGTYLRVVANGKEQGKRIHNLVACTLCSCYPQALLGVQPVWYKSQQHRARSVSAPRSVSLEFAESNGRHQVPLATRGGGHSYAGYSCTEGLMINLRNFATTQYDPASQTSSTGPSPRFAAAAPTRTFPTLPCGTAPSPTTGKTCHGCGKSRPRWTPITCSASPNPSARPVAGSPPEGGGARSAAGRTGRFRIARQG
jgi:hypothetical protein